MTKPKEHDGKEFEDFSDWNLDDAASDSQPQPSPAQDGGGNTGTEVHSAVRAIAPPGTRLGNNPWGDEAGATTEMPARQTKELLARKARLARPNPIAAEETAQHWVPPPEMLRQATSSIPPPPRSPVPPAPLGTTSHRLLAQGNAWLRRQPRRRLVIGGLILLAILITIVVIIVQLILDWWWY